MIHSKRFDQISTSNMHQTYITAFVSLCKGSYYDEVALLQPLHEQQLTSQSESNFRQLSRFHGVELTPDIFM